MNDRARRRTDQFHTPARFHPDIQIPADIAQIVFKRDRPWIEIAEQEAAIAINLCHLFQTVRAAVIPLGESFNNIDQKQFSQEFQLTGTLFDGVVDFTGGLYYLKEKATDSNLLTFAFADFVSGGDVDNDSYAAYLQATINVTDRFSITPGIRYTDETKRFDPSRQRITDDRTGGALLLLSRCFVRQTPIIPPDPALCPTPDTTLNPQGDNILSAVEVQTKASEWTPALSLDYKVTDQTLIYASYSKGFKSGGFTQRIFPPEPAATPFAPEFVESYEVGVKSELFDRRLRLNIAAFQADYTDIQIVVNEGIAPKVRNAGRARIRGIEVETQAKLADFLTIQGGFGYLDAYYREVSPTSPPPSITTNPNATALELVLPFFVT